MRVSHALIATALLVAACDDDDSGGHSHAEAQDPAVADLQEELDQLEEDLASASASSASPSLS